MYNPNPNPQEELTGFHENVNVNHVMARCLGLARTTYVSSNSDSKKSTSTGIIIASAIGAAAVVGGEPPFM